MAAQIGEIYQAAAIPFCGLAHSELFPEIFLSGRTPWGIPDMNGSAQVAATGHVPREVLSLSAVDRSWVTIIIIVIRSKNLRDRVDIKSNQQQRSYTHSLGQSFIFFFLGGWRFHGSESASFHFLSGCKELKNIQTMLSFNFRCNLFSVYLSCEQSTELIAFRIFWFPNRLNRTRPFFFFFFFCLLRQSRPETKIFFRGSYQIICLFFLS